jgi:hypothetical protein
MTMPLALIFLPIGLAILGFIVALLVDAVVHDRASRLRAASRRETVPMRPWPHPERDKLDQRRQVLVRDERGHAEVSFLRKLTMVCFIVLVLSGLVVYWIGESTPDHTPNHPPAGVHPSPTAKKPHSANQVAAAREGGGNCGEGS